jgi:hypothetical protein
MRRLLFLALLAFAVLAVPAAAQTADSPSAGAACSDPDDGASLMVASSADDGGVTASDTGDPSTGGTPATWDAGSSDAGAGDAPVPAGDASSAYAEGPAAVVAQEPEPEPEGPGEEQPGEQPPPVEVPDVPGGEAPAGEAPAGETGGGLPRTGLEVLQLALLGIVLVLVGARLRVLALRRKHRASDPGWDDPEPVYAEDAYPSRGDDGWSFPDPSEPAPTGLLPSTASARRQARALAMSGDRE